MHSIFKVSPPIPAAHTVYGDRTFNSPDMKQSHDAAECGDKGPPRKSAADPTLVDDILLEIGDFGLYQVLVAILTGMVMLLASAAQFNFVFTGDVPDHRCRIPECEPANSLDFKADWLEFAVPYTDGRPDSCHRFQYVPSDANDVSAGASGACTERHFDRSQIVPCDGIFVKNNEERLVTRLGMLCTGQDSKMTLIGTASTFGRLFGLPIAGIVSDKFGRLITIVGCVLLATLFGCLQALPVPLMSFELYLALEFLVSGAMTGVCATCFVFNMEWVTLKYRVVLNCLASLADGSHVFFVGLAAWYFEASFTAFRLMVAGPGLLALLLFFVLGESPRWLLTKRKYSRTIKSLTHAGAINGRRPCEQTIKHIRYQSTQTSIATPQSPLDDDRPEVTMRAVLGEKVLFMRLFVLALMWFFVVLAYYGIIMMSTKAHDNKYASFVMIGAAELLGNLMMVGLMDRIGRRMTIGVPLLVYGLVLFVYTQVSAQSFVQLALLIIGRACITCSFTALYAYTIELWPTSIRSTTINLCSMVGRVGGILASVSVLLANYYPYLPNILYGSVTIVSSILLFVFLPETLHSKELPETLSETIAIGRKAASEATQAKQAADKC